LEGDNSTATLEVDDATLEEDDAVVDKSPLEDGPNTGTHGLDGLDIADSTPKTSAMIDKVVGMS
jgi:hypothetical protein